MGKPPAPCPWGLARVPVCACRVHVYLCCVHWALVHACTCLWAHTHLCAQACVPVCAGSCGPGPVNWKSLRQTCFWVEEELHPLPRNLTWGPRASSDGGAEAGQGDLGRGCTLRSAHGEPWCAGVNLEFPTVLLRATLVSASFPQHPIASTGPRDNSLTGADPLLLGTQPGPSHNS